MLFTSPGNIAFSIFNYQVYWYGIFMFLAILAGLYAILFIRKKHYPEFDEDFILDLSFILILFGILGARVYYVLCDFGYYSTHLPEIFALRNGGLSIHGAILGAITGGLLFTSAKNKSFFKVADLMTYGLVVGQIIGRWGNFFNSEAFGVPCELPWKLYIPISSRPLEYLSYDYFHPTFLYESVLSLCIFCILYFVLRKINGIKDGTIFLSYLILYSVVRLVVETFRTDSVVSFGVFHIAHIACAVTIVVAIITLKIIYTSKPNVNTK